MNEHPRPVMSTLVSCVRAMAAAMGMPSVEREGATTLLASLLYRPQSEGGRDLWACFADGIITAPELHAAVMAHCASWIARAHGVREPDYPSYGSEELERAFHGALFGDPGLHTT